MIYRYVKTENKHDTYRGKDCTKKFSESLREHRMEIINFKKNFKNISLILVLIFILI